MWEKDFDELTGQQKRHLAKGVFLNGRRLFPVIEPNYALLWQMIWLHGWQYWKTWMINTVQI